MKAAKQSEFWRKRQMNTLKAEKRSMSIKAKRLRREGYVTGNVFGRDIQESIPVKIERTVVERLLKTCNKGSQILLDVDGQAYDVLIKDISFNAMKGIVEEIDFQALVRGEKVHSVAEVILVNHDKVMNGVLQQQLQEISYKALPEALIDKVRIDVGDMKVGDTIRVADLDIAKNKNVDLVTDLDTTVATVTAVHAAAEEPAEGTEEAASETK
ncbi:ribosomal protein L25, Ctc-form [Hungatella hathewayi DSM 13479]|uniref:Ribosomal protein L25, Ctc-form n=2 Tax=Hungatella hathewayi TaxID=154046 RepID=D3ATR0_9FIRM|nr:ribosomal protein L25, Ctc-form [Hungatella hathewayi DSM 13479]